MVTVAAVIIGILIGVTLSAAYSAGEAHDTPKEIWMDADVYD